MEYQNKNLIIMIVLVLDVSITYESNHEIGSDGEVYTSDGFYEGIEIPKPVKADLRKNYGPDGSMRQGPQPGTDAPGFSVYTKGPQDGSPVGPAGILPGFNSETESGSNENAFPGHFIIPGGRPVAPDYQDMKNSTSNSTDIDPAAQNGPAETENTPDEKLPEGEQNFTVEETFSGKMSTLKPLLEVRPCADCPDVYLPVCANVSGLMLSYQNVCFFVCLKLKNAYVIRRGNCIYFRRSLY